MKYKIGVLLLLILSFYALYETYKISEVENVNIDQKPVSSEPMLENSDVKYSRSYTVEIYKTVDCPCCVDWVKYIEKNLIQTKVFDLDNAYFPKKRSELGIPDDMTSCHLSKIGDYYIEGHVPVSAIDYLMEKKPDWIGIAVPGMPAGSPGMPGSSEYDVFALLKGKAPKKILRYKDDQLIEEIKE